jgi:microcystin-dependent protein
MANIRRKKQLSRVRTTAGLREFTGDSGSGGAQGVVPKPASGDSSNFLKGDGTWGQVVPAGSVQMYAGTTEPSGWLFCYGQAISRTTYAALFAVLSTTYGAGDGSTTFNLPDIRGRVVAGQDDMGGSSANRLTLSEANGIDGDVLGGTGGHEDHTLVSSEMPSHTHGAGSYETVDSNILSNASTDTNNQTGGGGNIVKTASSARESIQGTSSSAGSDGAHNNVQPTIILNYIMKT